MKLIHTGDWHLSAQRSKLDAETDLNARVMDFYRCARFAIEDGVKRGAQLICHCGDVFHSCRPTPTEVRLAKDAFAPALERGVPVIALKGNHDDVRAPAEKHALALLARGSEQERRRALQAAGVTSFSVDGLSESYGSPGAAHPLESAEARQLLAPFIDRGGVLAASDRPDGELSAGSAM